MTGTEACIATAESREAGNVGFDVAGGRALRKIRAIDIAIRGLFPFLEDPAIIVPNHNVRA